jgi:hypothetical protein
VFCRKLPGKSLHWTGCNFAEARKFDYLACRYSASGMERCETARGVLVPIDLVIPQKREIWPHCGGNIQHMFKRGLGLALWTLLGGAVASHAATITWGAATDISGDADVATAGTVVGAFALGDSSVYSPTVNGVSFTGLDISSSSATSGNFTYSITSGPGPTADTSGGSNSPFSTLSTDYQELLSSAAWGNATLTMSGLTPGADYLFEFWTDDSADPDSEVQVDNLTLQTNPKLPGQPGQGPGELGQFATGTFIADGSGVDTVDFESIPHGGAPEINAFQLRELVQEAPTPEPSTLMLMACGGLLAFCWRRVHGREAASRN